MGRGYAVKYENTYGSNVKIQDNSKIVIQKYRKLKIAGRKLL